jgi:gustatory receptor
MNYLRLSKRDVRYLDGIYKIGNILAISPGYNFEKDIIMFPRLTKIYGFLATTGLVALEIMTLLGNVHYNNATELASAKIVSFINSSSLVALVISMILSSCVYNQQSWTTLNKNFQYVDKQLNNRNTTSKKFYKNIYFRGTVILGIVLCIQSYAVCQFQVSKSYFFHQLCHFCELFTITLTHNIITTFKYRYKDLNKMLETDNYMKSKIIPSKNAVAFIRTVAQLRRTLTENVTCFNAIFGWPLIFLIGRGVLQLLSSLQFLLFYLNLPKNVAADPFLIIFNLFIFIYMSVR